MSTTLPLESEVCVPFRRYAQRAGVSPTSATRVERLRSDLIPERPAKSPPPPDLARITTRIRTDRGAGEGVALWPRLLVVAFAPSGLRHACPANGLPRAHRLRPLPTGHDSNRVRNRRLIEVHRDPERRPPRVEGRAGSNPSCTRQAAPAEDPAPMKAPVLACGSWHARWGSSGSSC